MPMTSHRDNDPREDQSFHADDDDDTNDYAGNTTTATMTTTTMTTTTRRAGQSEHYDDSDKKEDAEDDDDCNEHDEEEESQNVDETSADGDDDDDAEEEEEEEHNPTLSSQSSYDYLFEKSALKQHAIAVLIAIVGSAIGYFHLAEETALSTSVASRHRAVSTESTAADHPHKRYRRTRGISFCPLDGNDGDSAVALLHSDRNNPNVDVATSDKIRRVLFAREEQTEYEYRDNDHDGHIHIDPNLQLFDFIIPIELAEVMMAHYVADDSRDDDYHQYFASLNADATEEETTAQAEVHSNFTNRNYQCLVEQIRNNPKHIKGTSVAYITPHINTYYRTKTPPSVAIAKPGRNGDGDNDEPTKIRPASLSFTGFAAKFVNLSPKTLHLYWDGGSGTNHGEKLVAVVPPFEAVGTATTPGQSFHFTPTYDKEHALKRWVVTPDDAIAVYDPFRDKSKSDAENRRSMERELQTPEQRYKYKMQLLNLAYNREYLIKTGRLWLSGFPRPVPTYPMWDARYFGQRHTVATKEIPFVALPPSNEMNRYITPIDYQDRVERDLKYPDEPAPLSQYRRKVNQPTMNMTLKVLSVSPRVFEIPNFLSKFECEHIIHLSTDGRYNITLTQSTVHPGGEDITQQSTSDGNSNGSSSGGGGSGSVRGQKDKATRSSTNAWVYRETSPIIDSIYRRAADLLQIDESLLRHREDHEHLELATHHSISEAMQLVHYGVDEEYTAHHDFTYPIMTNRYQPSRFATLLLYLNDVDGMDGGETNFPRAINSEFHDGIKVQPKMGKAVLFYNVLPDGNVDDLSQHSSLKVVKGEKWLANLWIWDPIIN